MAGICRGDAALISAFGREYARYPIVSPPPSPGMQVRLLGPIEASLDGRPVALGPPQQRAVLAMLALQVNRTVSTDRLTEGLWDEWATPSAHKLVQLYVSRLRKLPRGQAAFAGSGKKRQLGGPSVRVAPLSLVVHSGVKTSRSRFGIERSPGVPSVGERPLAGRVVGG
jgi:hypothetical protein